MAVREHVLVPAGDPQLGEEIGVHTPYFSTGRAAAAQSR